MKRQTVTMQPTNLRELRREAAAQFRDLRQAVGSLGEVLTPAEAEEPILAPVARAAVFEWMAEIRAMEELEAVGLRPRNTALLQGPPGCGKTTLAHHLAARLGVPMVVVGAENLNAKYWGEAEQNVARLFDGLSRSETPCLLFLDEIDAIGGSRDKNTGGSADNGRTSMLTVLLRKVEAFQGMMIAATNRGKDLDPALWRRFHLQVTVDLPGEEERFAILRRYAQPFAFSDEDLDVLADLTDGASPALLRGLMEGMKRTIVLAPRLRRSADSAEAVIGALVGHLAPPPEIEPPPLWADPRDAMRRLSALSWPPQRG